MFPFLVLLIFSFYSALPAIPIENGIIDNPEVICSSEGIDIIARTLNPFLGRIFVKGKAYTPHCSVSPSQYEESTNPKFFLSFEQCGMQRLRMLNPRGMSYSTTVIVSFHPLFITKVDRAYKVNCFYGEVDAALTARIDVSEIPTTNLADSHRMPRCMYTVRQGTVDGPIINFSKVGDHVFHRWECDSELYGFLVKDCFVEDQSGKQVLVMNDLGCSLDPVLLGPVSYDSAVSLAFAESHVFKFADVSRTQFICKIQICFKSDGGCEELLPPRCDPESRRQARAVKSANDELDVKRELIILDLDEDFDDVSREKETEDPVLVLGAETTEEEEEEGCLISGAGLVGVLMSMGVISVLLSVVLFIVFRRSKKASVRYQ